MKELTYEELQSICKEWMENQDSLTLRRDYDDYLDSRDIGRFLDYVDEEVKKWNLYEWSSYLYEYLCYYDWRDWFNGYEHDCFYDKYVQPFIDEFGDEYEFDESELDEILRELMYDLNMYDANIEHFDKRYNFYILTNPEKTLTVCDDFIPAKVFKDRYYYSLINSQGWSYDSKQVRELRDWAWWILWVWVKINCNLSYMVELIKSKRLTIKEGSSVFLFNSYNWSWGCDTVLINDWTINNDHDNIWYGVDDWSIKWPRGYTPDDVYGWYHPAFDKNKITFKSLKK